MTTMLPSNRRRGTLLACLAACLLGGSGCTVMLHSVGREIDTETSPWKPIHSSVLYQGTAGQPVRISLADSTQLEGMVVEMRTDPDYQTRYEAFRDTFPATSPLPALGETLRVRARGDADTEVVFQGFDRLTGTAGEDEAGPWGIVQLGVPGRDQPARLYLAALEEFTDRQGRDLAPSRLQEQVDRLPGLSVISLHTERDTIVVPLDRIVLVEVWSPVRSTGRLTAVGATVDFIVIACVVTFAILVASLPPMGN